MVAQFPDELINEILSTALAVSEEMFTSKSKDSPFLRYDNPSSSVILEVCKQWLRVATPHLYHFIVVRTKGQAKALARTFRTNPAFGLFVRKARLEGGYGAPMGAILLATPNVTDLFLSLDIRSNDTVPGLCRLSSLNPVRVILQDFDHNHNRPTDQVIKHLCESIPQWKRLKTFDCPSAKRGEPIIMALNRSSTLEILQLSYMNWEHLSAVKCPSIKTIYIADTKKWRWREAEFRAEVDADSRLQELVKYAPVPSRTETLAPPTVTRITAKSPSFVPLASVSVEDRAFIWTKVITFATTYDGADAMKPKSPKLSRCTACTRISLLLVSKEFNRLSHPVLYGHLRFFRNSGLELFAKRLTSDPSLGRHVRSLYFPRPEDSSGLHILDKILDLMPELQQLQGIDNEFSRTETAFETIKWSVFKILANLAGHSLVVLRTVKITAPYNSQSPAIFEGFSQLRHLDWYSETVFSREFDKVSPKCLANLEQLSVFQCHGTFWDALKHMSLPSLQRLILPGNYTLESLRPFLQTHGGKIRHLEISDYSKGILSACPAITVLVLETPPSFSDFTCTPEHQCLSKIIVRSDANFKHSAPSWKNFLDFVDWSQFSALREIHFEDCQWPTQERDFAKHFWVEAAELMWPWDVRLTNKQGISWKPRLR